MLVAFDGDRDYEQALRLARALVEHYPNTRFYPYAKGFCDQLPRRMDDFKTLRLPTPREWAEMKPKLSRRQQIDFLCQRLRLLNCFQMGQPGGYVPSETQYAESCGLSEDAAWGRNKGKTVVINPLVELEGDRYGFLPTGQQPSKGLELTVADIPAPGTLPARGLVRTGRQFLAGFLRRPQPGRHPLRHRRADQRLGPLRPVRGEETRGDVRRREGRAGPQSHRLGRSKPAQIGRATGHRTRAGRGGP